LPFKPFDFKVEARLVKIAGENRGNFSVTTEYVSALKVTGQHFLAGGLEFKAAQSLVKKGIFETTAMNKKVDVGRNGKHRHTSTFGYKLTAKGLEVYAEMTAKPEAL